MAHDIQNICIRNTEFLVAEACQMPHLGYKVTVTSVAVGHVHLRSHLSQDMDNLSRIGLYMTSIWPQQSCCVMILTLKPKRVGDPCFTVYWRVEMHSRE